MQGNVVSLREEWVQAGASPRSAKQVLIVDDQRSARVILECIIRNIDRQIGTAMYGSPLEAIEWARTNTPDLVLIDYKMREIDGIETIRRLRQMPTCADVPIVMVTVSSDMKIRHDAFDAGATDFLVKPYDQYECRARCRNLLTMREQHLLLKDRAKLLQFEVAGAMRQMRSRERESIMLAANLAEYHANQHGLRVIRIARYAGIIAEGIGLDQEMVDRIELASTLHDVGKIGVADEVLSAAENLTAAQEQALRGHVEIGHKLLEHCASANLVMAAEICLSHHERYDGRGYPRGLSGRDIPLPARIVAVAEAFEAFTMSSPADDVDRVATALRGIREESGTAYDPVCVEALSVEADKARRILGMFADSA